MLSPRYQRLSLTTCHIVSVKFPFFPNGCNYSVNEDRTIHCLHDSIPQVEDAADDISQSSGLLLW